MHRASRFASASPVGQLGQRGVKDTTGIVGIDVDPNARASLRDICQQVLKAIQVVPDTAEYRRSVESAMKYRWVAGHFLERSAVLCWGSPEQLMLCCHRIKQVDSDQADEDIESAFGLQLEQLILQGKSELDLIPMMAGRAPCHVAG